ncbi:transporter substrate-binding domain-containing protein [Pseudoduganella sp. LjRoot289]|uniref:substrate-binding periplasmic protein n=1 Tax=Pseudoduganella sp. LjRoot289 TaxID=3342314 RepID=UPI003ECCDE71
MQTPLLPLAPPPVPAFASAIAPALAAAFAPAFAPAFVPEPGPVPILAQVRLPMWAVILAAMFAMALTPNPARPAHAAEQQVDAYNTYLSPPFLMPDGGGLAAELVERLNAHLTGQYRLRLRHIPRQRLMLAGMRDPASFEGVGLLLSPAFVKEDRQPRFLWSEPVFYDYNVLVFAGPNAPRLSSAADLAGLRFGAIIGYRYLYLEQLLAAGRLRRQDTNAERLNLRKVALGRVDFTQMNRLLYGAIMGEPEFAGKLAAVPEPGAPPFARRLFVGPHRAALLARLNAALAVLPCDPQWRASADRHGINLPSCSAR